ELILLRVEVNGGGTEIGGHSYNDSAKITYDRDDQKAGSPGARCRSRDKPEQNDRAEPQECQFNEVDHHPVALPSSRTTSSVAGPAAKTSYRNVIKLSRTLHCCERFLQCLCT